MENWGKVLQFSAVLWIDRAGLVKKNVLKVENGLVRMKGEEGTEVGGVIAVWGCRG